MIIVRLGLRLDGLQLRESAENFIPRVSFDPLFLKTEVLSRSFAGKTGTEWGRYKVASGSVNRRWSDP